MIHDVIIIGGSYAGMSAALQLARARRTILVIDAGEPRNRFAASSHGFLTQDGKPPEMLAQEGREQLLTYETVRWLSKRVQSIQAVKDGFLITAEGDQEVTGRRIILAVGVTDHLPDLPGLAERWGKSVFHCPYCHGFELQRGRIGVLASSPLSMHQALMLPDWGETIFFLNGAFVPDENQRTALQARAVAIEAGLVDRLDGTRVDVVMKDGRIIPLDGMFTMARTSPASPLAVQAGCELEETPLGIQIKTDQTQATSVPGVFACGDAAKGGGSVALAVGAGAMAGVAAHRSLMFGL